MTLSIPKDILLYDYMLEPTPTNSPKRLCSYSVYFYEGFLLILNSDSGGQDPSVESKKRQALGLIGEFGSVSISHIRSISMHDSTYNLWHFSV